MLTIEDTGWTEAAREAARRAKAAGKGLLSALRRSRQSALYRPQPPQPERPPNDWRTPGKAEGSWLARRDLPYKVAQYDPDKRSYKILTSKWTFPEAYNHPSGTHVVQTHVATAGEFERVVRGHSESGEATRLAQRAGVGLLAAGPLGAAVGLATAGSKHGKWYELPTPIITSKAQTIPINEFREFAAKAPRQDTAALSDKEANEPFR
jgi:hypothetical protein